MREDWVQAFHKLSNFTCDGIWLENISKAIEPLFKKHLPQIILVVAALERHLGG